MKSFSNLISVQKNTNRFIAGTNCDWSLVKQGDFVKLKDENLLYQVVKTNKFIFIKDFEVDSARKIKIKDDTGIELIKGDELILSYKEYELFAVFEITNPGDGYKKGDILYVDGGEPSYNVTNGVPEKTEFIVDLVGERGEIKKINIKHNGKYTIPPNNQNNIISINGKNAVFELEYRMINQRKSLERRVAAVRFDAPYTIVTLDYELTDKFKDGKLSCQKWEMLIDKNYLLDSKLEVECQILRDYSPNLRLPYMLANSSSQHLLFNHLVNRLDQEISDIKNRLDKIQNNS